MKYNVSGTKRMLRQGRLLQKTAHVSLVTIFVVSFVFSGWGVNVPDARAAETKYASSHLTGDAPNPTNAVGAANGTWAGDLNNNADYTSRWAMEDPSGSILGTQTIQVLAKKGSNSGTPQLTATLYENGASVQTVIAATNITSTTGQTISGTFDGSAITNPNNVEIQIFFDAAGGSPTARNSAQVDSITWTVELAPPTFDQAAYRFFDDSTSVTPGTVLEDQDTPASLSTTGEPFRLRMLTHVGSSAVGSSGQVFKLQYAEKSGTCDTSFTGETYADVSSTTPIAFYDVAGISGNSALGAQADLTHGGDTIVNQTYEEANNFTNSQGSILLGQDGKWDFSLYDNGAPASTAYCMRLVTSTDAQSWTAQSAAGDNDNWVGVAYGSSKYVAVGQTTGDRVMTSSNGTDWTARSASGDDDNWRDVVFANSKFVAVSSGFDYAMTSSDGITWASQSAPAGVWYGVTYGNGLFVAVSGGGSTYNVMTSPDGENWTGRNAAGDNDDLTDVVFGGDKFVAVGTAAGGADTFVITSTDGITWTAQSPGLGDNDSWQAVTYGDGLFVAVGTSGDRVMTSPDGITWTARSAAGDNDGWNGVTYSNGLFVAVGNSGDRVMTSPDGITWTARSAAGDNDGWTDIAYNNGQYVAVGLGSSSFDHVITSSDSSTVDTYSVVPEIITSSGEASASVSQLHYRWREDNVSESSTSFTGTEDTQLNTSSVQIGDRVRLRVLLSNSGQAAATDYAYRLNYSSGACSAWSAVPSSGDAEAWVMTTSARVSNGQATTNNTGLTDPGGLAFSAGVVVAGINQAATSTLSASDFTEHEFVLRSTLNVSTGTTYCFRVSNGDSTTNFTYDVIPSLVLPIAVRPQSGGSSSSVEAPAAPSTPQTGGSEGGGNGTEGGGGGAPEGGGGEGGGGGGDLGLVSKALATVMNAIWQLIHKLR